jgi:mannose-6-phosphate isomerase-like protein (cupin superfamily)
MKSFHLDALLSKMRHENAAWLEFLRAGSFSMGVYCLKAGELDLQSPHSEDEIYYVLSGRGKFQADSEERLAKPGAIFFVERLVEHRFFDIQEDLTALVFFAPAEGSLREAEHSP